MKEKSSKEKRKEEAILSGDPNRILLICKRGAATILYYNNLNAVTASKLPDSVLLGKRGINIKTIHAVRWAIETANKSIEGLKRKEWDLKHDISKLKEQLIEARARAKMATGDKDSYSMFICTIRDLIAEKNSFLKDVRARVRKK